MESNKAISFNCSVDVVITIVMFQCNLNTIWLLHVRKQ